MIAWDWSSFNTGVLSNGIATLIGVAAGVPLGLWINRRTERTQDRSERLRVARLHLVSLRALHAELTHNFELIEGRLHADFVRKEMPYYRLDVDLWPAAMPTLLQAIDDPSLLDGISRLYHRLEEFNRIIDAWERAAHDAVGDRLEGYFAQLADELAGKFNKAKIEARDPVRLMLPRIQAAIERIEQRVAMLGR